MVSTLIHCYWRLKLVLLVYVLFYYAEFEGKQMSISYTERSFSISAMDNLAPVDEQLYSRQLMVYGISAQQRLASFPVTIVALPQRNTSSSPADGLGLAAEILKNLALSGLGNMTICDMTMSTTDRGRRLEGRATSLCSYARDINSRLSVSCHP
jgi:hypothetical protein